jgi:hypothetical protein
MRYFGRAEIATHCRSMITLSQVFALSIDKNKEEPSQKRECSLNWRPPGSWVARRKHLSAGRVESARTVFL